jgi:hypothetical protein
VTGLSAPAGVEKGRPVASLSVSSTPSLILQFPISRIRELAARYSFEDDASVMRMGEAARTRGHFTRPEFVTVCAWKTARSKPLVAANTEADVQEATRLALATSSEVLRIQIPMALNGVSWGTSSVLLHLAHRDPYPIIDYRALEALGLAHAPSYTLSLWLAYAAKCRQLATAAHVDMRTLDRALWQWSKERSP